MMCLRGKRLLAVMGLALCMGPIGFSEVRGQGVAPSSQASVAAPAASIQAAAVMVPQCQVVYETVYETRCVQVPVTQMQTRYRTEYRTNTVPVRRTVTEMVSTTQMQTQNRTEYRTQTVPVTRTVTEMVPTTQMQTQNRTE